MKAIQIQTFLIILLHTVIPACQQGTGCNGLKADLIQADIQFSDLSVKEGMKKAFLQFADDSVVLLRENAWPIIGRETLDQYFSQLLDSGFTLSWEPLDAFMAESCDMGFTYGTFSMVNKASGQKSMGTYVSIWKKQADGSWKFILDSGNEGLGK